MSLAGIEPVGFGVKSDLRKHCAIVQPRWYDCLMVTPITLNTEPHGLDSCQGHSTEKLLNTRRLIRSPWPGVVEGDPTTELVKRSPPASSHGVVRSRTARLSSVKRRRNRSRLGSDKVLSLDDKARIMADQPPLRRPEGSPWGPSVLRVIGVTIKQSYNRGCTIT